MTRRRIEVLLALGLCIGLALAGFAALKNGMRSVEVHTVLGVLDGSGVSAVDMVRDHTFQVLPHTGLPFRAHVTPFCSALVAVLALAAITIFILRGPLWKRLVAFTTAAVVIVACNVLRIAASLWVGVHWGVRSLVLFHDWVGTIFGLGYTMGGFFLMLFLLLPSAKDRKLVRAARVSDVL